MTQRSMRVWIGTLVLLLLAGQPAWAETVHYEYDSMGRVTRATYGAEHLLAYTYDRMDNRQTRQSLSDVLDEGLIIFFPFEEGSGVVTADASGRGHIGYLQNGVAWSPNGIAGQALSFDGADDYLLVPQHADLNLTGTFTLSAWVNTDLSQSGTLLSKDGVGGDPTGAYNVYLTQTEYEVPYTQYETNNAGSLYAYWGLTENAWHQVVVTYMII